MTLRQTTPRRDRRVPLKYALPLLGYLALCGVLLRGVGGVPFRRVAGLADFHVWEQLWYLWQWRSSLAAGTSPLTTTLLNFPEGLSVYHQMPTLIMPLLGSALASLAGLAGGYNLLVGATLLCAAFGAFLLCLRICGRPGESVLGGLVFGFSPFLQTELAGGMAEQALGAALLPWLLLLLLRLNESRTRRAAIAAALCLAAVALSSWYCGVMALLLVGLQLFAGLRESGPDTRRGLLAAYLALATASLLLLAAPTAILVAGTDLQRNFNWKAACAVPGIRDKVCLDVTGLVIAGDAGRARATEPGLPRLIPFSVYLGKITALFTLLALLTPTAAWRRWKTGFALFLLLALGPYLNVGGRIAWIGDHALPLPNRLLVALAPWLSRLWALHNYRFIALALLFAGILTCLGVARLLDALAPGRAARVAVLALLGWLILADFGQSVPGARALALPTVAIDVPAAYQVIRDAPDGAVLNIPLPLSYRTGPLIAGRQMYYQTFHGHPLLSATTSFERPAAVQLPLVAAAQQASLGEALDLDEAALGGGWARLREMGYAFVTLQPELLSPREARRWRELLARQLGAPLAEAGGVAVFRIDQAAGTGARG